MGKPSQSYLTIFRAVFHPAGSSSEDRMIDTHFSEDFKSRTNPGHHEIHYRTQK